MGTALVRAYVLLFMLGIAVFVMHGGHPLSGLFLIILALPWSAIAAFPMAFLEVRGLGRLIIVLFFAFLNARLLYRIGEKLQ